MDWWDHAAMYWDDVTVDFTSAFEAALAEGFWRSRDGVETPIHRLTDTHLCNALRFTHDRHLSAFVTLEREWKARGFDPIAWRLRFRVHLGPLEPTWSAPTWSALHDMGRPYLMEAAVPVVAGSARLFVAAHPSSGFVGSVHLRRQGATQTYVSDRVDTTCEARQAAMAWVRRATRSQR